MAICDDDVHQEGLGKEFSIYVSNWIFPIDFYFIFDVIILRKKGLKISFNEKLIWWKYHNWWTFEDAWICEECLMRAFPSIYVDFIMIIFVCCSNSIKDHIIWFADFSAISKVLRNFSYHENKRKVNKDNFFPHFSGKWERKLIWEYPEAMKI